MALQSNADIRLLDGLSQSATMCGLSLQFKISWNYPLQNENKNRLNVPILILHRPSYRSVAALRTQNNSTPAIILLCCCTQNTK